MKRERIEELSELINKRGKLTLEQLEEYFPKVSQMTLRRDLFQLEEEGKIIRIRGGALSVKDVQKTSGEPYVKKTALHTDEKIAIAQKAAMLVDEGTSIFIDGGTTALYFAKERPVVNIDGNLIMADDDRLPEEYRDRIEMKKVRFRTLGCWPLTGAVESDADTIEKIVEEMMTTTKSERTTRVIDFDQDASMEQKKREGYF